MRTRQRIQADATTRLLEQLFDKAAMVADHVARELVTLDGFPAAGERLSVMASNEMTSTESAALARALLTNQRDEFTDGLRFLVADIHALHRAADALLRARLPRESTPGHAGPALCVEAQRERDGALEWGDPLCPLPAVKGGLCVGHYHKMRRWKMAHGIDTSRDFEPGVVG